MNAGQREGGQQKTRFSLHQESGFVCSDTLLPLLSDRILAPCERHLGCPPRLPGPALEGLS